ncbi:hypothetical protein JR316_0005277 [Psilocybe cubensis]|uniref:DUF6534 domain-containing protein n=2 Tax=Psilocybe cubensis TaxID=181762 RepID=A0A8H7Y246_PSICU|nr:hypothetical protein JR316_0005277 [Psilocybe cubensis]KAH9483173.1 hypothetical protein JR316_0005277 [Psilocybe cubensis]
MVISAVAGVMALSSGIYGDALGISMFNHHSTYRSLVTVWIAAQTLADILIATSLILYPAFPSNPEKVKRPYSGSRSSHITGKLMRTGSFSAVFSIAVLILFLASKQTSVYIVFLLPLGRLYTNSFLGILQDREKEIKDIQGSGEITTDMWAVPSTAPGNQSFSLSGMRIRGERALSTIEDMSDADKSDDRLGKRRSSDDRSRMDKISEMNEPTAV